MAVVSLLLILTAIPTILCDSQLTTPSKPRVFTHYSNKYLLGMKKLTFYAANFQCRSHGMILANDRSVSDHSALMDFLQTTDLGSDGAWLGAADMGAIQKGYHFYWIEDSEPISYSVWGAGRPLKNYNSTLVILGQSGLWIDNFYYDEKSRRFVCEVVKKFS